jgi:hypothetical protein
MTAPADRRNLILSLDRWPGSATPAPVAAPHIHIQAQTLPTGITDITTIDGPQLLKTPAYLSAVVPRGQSGPAATSLADSR